MAWEKAEIMFPTGRVPVENETVSIEQLRLSNPPFTTTTIRKMIRNAIEYDERLVWYSDGTLKRYHIYDIGFDESKLPDGQSALNIYGQKILKDHILSITENQKPTPIKQEKKSIFHKLFKKNTSEDLFGDISENQQAPMSLKELTEKYGNKRKRGICR